MSRPDSLTEASGAAGAAPPTERTVASEVYELWQRSRPADVRAFLGRHPEFAADLERLQNLAFEEYCQRRQRGEAPDAEEFCARFPACRSALRTLIEAESFVEAHADLVLHAEPTPWPAPGEVFLGFELVREVGRGSFSRVFLAREPALGGRWVAVKVSKLGDTEAAILGRVPHANIVPAHSVRLDEGSGLIAVCMPYLGRATLADVCGRVAGRASLPRRARFILDAIREAAPPTGEEEPTPADPALRRQGYVTGVLHLGAQLAEALAYVHARGIYHRDLKPSNVLLTPGGRPMLLDFNLSFDEQLGRGWLGGTFPYMPPEQLRATASGEGGAAVDVRSDLYALGIILYELLAGRHPFGTAFPEGRVEELRAGWLRRQAAGPAPLRRVNPDLAPAAALAVDRCLAFDPAARPASAAELGVTLRRACSPWRRAGRWLAAHALGAAALAAVSGLAVVGVSVRAPESRSQLLPGPEAAGVADYRGAVRLLSRALEAEPDSDAARIARGRAYYRLGEFGLALQDFEKAGDQVCDGRMHARRAYCLNQLGQHEAAKQNHEAAIQHYEQAIAAGFATKEVYNNLGRSYDRARGRTLEGETRARKALTEAIALDPTFQPALHNRAVLELVTALNRKDYFPYVGIADIEAALRAGRAPDLLRDAARLYAHAAAKEPDPAKRPEWVRKSIQSLEEAVGRGGNPPSLIDVALAPLKEDAEARARFEELARRPVPPLPPPITPYFVDPCPDVGD